jgi:hypothetical protein
MPRANNPLTDTHRIDPTAKARKEKIVACLSGDEFSLCEDNVASLKYSDALNEINELIKLVRYN